MKEYNVTYSFGDVIRVVVANSKDEAERKAQDLLDEEGDDLHNESECYLVEVLENE